MIPQDRLAGIDPGTLEAGVDVVAVAKATKNGQE